MGKAFTLTEVGLREGHGALLYVAVSGGLIVQTHLGHRGGQVLPGVVPCGDLLNVAAQEKQQMFMLNTLLQKGIYSVRKVKQIRTTLGTLLHVGHFSLILQIYSKTHLEGTQLSFRGNPTIFQRKGRVEGEARQSN